MKIYIIPLFFYVFSSCSGGEVKIKHIDFLTEIDSVKIKNKLQINRIDYFVIYNFKDSINTFNKININIKNYSDSFAKKYDNYSVVFYKESKIADTSYIKELGKNYYYKALLDEKPFVEYNWWSGQLVFQSKKP